MESAVNTDVIILRFLGYGYGDSLIHRMMDPRVVDIEDHRALAFMTSTRMLEIYRYRRAQDYFTFRCQSHDVALKVKGTIDFLEKVYEFLSGQTTIHLSTWRFLVMSGFIQYYQPSEESDIQIEEDAEKDIQSSADGERLNYSTISSPLHSPIRSNSPTSEVPGPAIEADEDVMPQVSDRPSPADSESEPAEAQEPNVEGKAEPDMEAGPEPSAEASPEDRDRECPNNEDVVQLERVTETIPLCECVLWWAHMPSEHPAPQKAPTTPIHHAHQPVREAPYRLSDRDSALRFREQNMEEFNKRFEYLSNMSKIDYS